MPSKPEITISPALEEVNINEKPSKITFQEGFLSPEMKHKGKSLDVTVSGNN